MASGYEKQDLKEISRIVGKRVAVLGAGVSGLSLARLARRLGAEVFVSDASSISERAKRELNTIGASWEEGGHTNAILECELVVVGSGFPPTAEIISRVRDSGRPIIGELDLVLPYMSCRLIGVTGSNGKTTTVSLLGHLLKSLGLRSMVLGNIGDPIADAVGMEIDIAAIEMSSFQLHWSSSVELDCAIVTNLAPDHIDWHGSYANYVRDKGKIISFVRSGGASIVQSRDLETLAPAGAGFIPLMWNDASDGALVLSEEKRTAEYMGDVLFRFEDTKLIGSHNMENVAMAMVALRSLGLDIEGLSGALAGYVPPPHRCSLAGELGGVRYIDDSKGTNIAASVTAMSSIEGKKIIILGGRGKGEDYSMLVEPLSRCAKHAMLIGEEAQAIASALRAGGWTSFSIADCMEDAVRTASSMADPGEVVLLSPACTSWDMYKNYGERGDHFVKIVKTIIGDA